MAYQDWHPAKEGEDGAVPALVVNGPAQGEFKWVKIMDRDPDAAAQRLAEGQQRAQAAQKVQQEKERLNPLALHRLVSAMLKSPEGPVTLQVLVEKLLYEFNYLHVSDEKGFQQYLSSFFGLRWTPEPDDRNDMPAWESTLKAELLALGVQKLVVLWSLLDVIRDSFQQGPDEAVDLYVATGGSLDDLRAEADAAQPKAEVLEEAAADA